MKVPRHIREALAHEKIPMNQVAVSFTGGSHIKLTIEGAARAVVASMSPSCRYAHKHIAADIRKVMRQAAQALELVK